jgi:hypothetical protein
MSHNKKSAKGKAASKMVETTQPEATKSPLMSDLQSDEVITAKQVVVVQPPVEVATPPLAPPTPQVCKLLLVIFEFICIIFEFTLNIY